MFSGKNFNQKLITTCLLGFLSAAQGAENEHSNPQDPDLPDLEFLEFLGQFETDSGQWLDPGSLLSEEFGNLLDALVIPAPDSDSNIDSGANANSNSTSTDQQSSN